MSETVATPETVSVSLTVNGESKFPIQDLI